MFIISQTEKQTACGNKIQNRENRGLVSGTPGPRPWEVEENDNGPHRWPSGPGCGIPTTPQFPQGTSISGVLTREAI